jgi:hypothetical protein
MPIDRNTRRPLTVNHRIDFPRKKGKIVGFVANYLLKLRKHYPNATLRHLHRHNAALGRAVNALIIEAPPDTLLLDLKVRPAELEMQSALQYNPAPAPVPSKVQETQLGQPSTPVSQLTGRSIPENAFFHYMPVKGEPRTSALRVAGELLGEFPGLRWSDVRRYNPAVVETLKELQDFVEKQGNGAGKLPDALRVVDHNPVTDETLSRLAEGRPVQDFRYSRPSETIHNLTGLDYLRPSCLVRHAADAPSPILVGGGDIMPGEDTQADSRNPSTPTGRKQYIPALATTPERWIFRGIEEISASRPTTLRALSSHCPEQAATLRRCLDTLRLPEGRDVGEDTPLTSARLKYFEYRQASLIALARTAPFRAGKGGDESQPAYLSRVRSELDQQKLPFEIEISPRPPVSLRGSILSYDDVNWHNRKADGWKPLDPDRPADARVSTGFDVLPALKAAVPFRLLSRG